MLVCQCNMISDRDVENIVLEFLRSDPWQLVVPAMVYKELARQAKCAGCVPNVVDIIVKTTENFHLAQNRSAAEIIDVRVRLESLKKRRIGGRRERRNTGHRAA
jgi:bacterioferritin-associated ferredoxin